MLPAELFAGCLFVALIAADWWRFRRLTPSAARYGCPVARAEDSLPVEADSLSARFAPDGLLRLDHGIAQAFPDRRFILFRSQPDRFSSRFRTAWPLKGAIEWQRESGALRLRCVKLMPWSSALLTLLWFAIVAVGTLAFVVKFLTGGDAFSFGSLLLVMGVTAVGLLVLVLGLVTVSLAYRVEDQRLMQVYQELRTVLSPPTNETR